MWGGLFVFLRRGVVLVVGLLGFRAPPAFMVGSTRVVDL